MLRKSNQTATTLSITVLKSVAAGKETSVVVKQVFLNQVVMTEAKATRARGPNGAVTFTARQKVVKPNVDGARWESMPAREH